MKCFVYNKKWKQGARKLLEIGSVNYPSDANISFPFGWTRYWHTVSEKPLSIWILATRPTEFIRSSQLPNDCDWTWMMMKTMSTALSSYQRENEKPLEKQDPEFPPDPCSLDRLTENSSSSKNISQKEKNSRKKQLVHIIGSCNVPLSSNDHGSLHVPSIRE